MTDFYPHVSIITLNWNAWRETIECLESVLKLQYPNFNIIVIDNHSTDDSWPRLIDWASGAIYPDIQTDFPRIVFPSVRKPIDYLPLSVKEIGRIGNRCPKLLLLSNEQNEGFAKANNRGTRIALEHYNSQYVFLLNNDTVISPDSLQEIVTVMESESKIASAQAVIYYYHNPGKIANAGGFLLPWGQTKYRKKIANRNWQKVTFLNGCALIFKRQTLEKYGALTEDFFHGEEDFEYSMRLKQHKALKVCINHTKVYHKIGVTAHELLNGQTGKKVLLFAVNRLVDMKRFYPHLLWIIWRELALVYFFLMLWIQYREKPSLAWQVIKDARMISTPLEKVDNKIVQNILKGNQS